MQAEKQIDTQSAGAHNPLDDAQRQIDEMTAGLRRIRNLCNANPNNLSSEVQRVVRSVLRGI